MAVRNDGSAAFDGRESSKVKWRTTILLSLGILVALLARWGYQVITESPPPAPVHEPSKSVSETGREDALRQEAWQRVRPRLEEADSGTQKLTRDLAKRIETFFDERQSHSEGFAQAALGWRSKWQLLHGREAHRKFLTEQFSAYIFSQEEMAKLLEEVTTEYELGLKEIDNKLLVSARADVDEMHRAVVPAFANEQLLSEDFDRIFAKVATDVGKDLGVNVGQETAKFVISNVIADSLAAVATRLGVSAAILGTGATSSAVTFGAGIVVFFAVDYMLDWVTSWFYDPVGNVSAKVRASLDDVKTCIVSGAPDAWAVRDRLAEMAQTDPDPAVKARAMQVVKEIEGGGSLGLKYSLGRVAEVYRLARERTLRELVLGESP